MFDAVTLHMLKISVKKLKILVSMIVLNLMVICIAVFPICTLKKRSQTTHFVTDRSRGLCLFESSVPLHAGSKGDEKRSTLQRPNNTLRAADDLQEGLVLMLRRPVLHRKTSLRHCLQRYGVYIQRGAQGKSHRACMSREAVHV